MFLSTNNEDHKDLQTRFEETEDIRFGPGEDEEKDTRERWDNTATDPREDLDLEHLTGNYRTKLRNILHNFSSQ